MHRAGIERRRFRTTRSRGVAIVSALCVVWMLGPVGPSRAEDEPQIVAEGTVRDAGDDAGVPLFVDRVNRRMYARGGSKELIEYDLSRPAGSMFVRSKQFDLNSALREGNYNAFDPVARKLYVLDMPLAVAQAACRREPPPCATIRTIDLTTLEFTDEQWDIPRLLPDFTPMGMTFSAIDGRLYVVGTMVGPLSDLTTWLKAPVMPVVVAAIDVGSTGLESIAWVRPIKTCTLPMVDVLIGTGIYRSSRFPALYFACSRADGLSGGTQLPGHVGVVRLWIDPDGTGAEALDTSVFREDFYRASGSFGNVSGFTARTAFDPVTERLVLVSNSANTPGVWVFDGVLSAWAGFVLSEGGFNNGLGLDPATGTMSVMDGPTKLLVADLRTTPITQGQRYAMPEGVAAADTLFDGRGRMYLVSGKRIVVLRAPSLPSRPSHEIDYDDITQDVDEGPDTNVTFAGSSAGFGGRVMLVGGPGGATAFTRPATLKDTIDGEINATPFLAPGDRGFQLGRLSVLDLRDSGAQASAQAVSLDDSTSNDDRTLRALDLHHEASRAAKAAAEQSGSDLGGAESAFEPLAGSPERARKPLASTSWPWGPAFCSDGSNVRDEDSQRQGASDATVTCDLKTTFAGASSHATGTESGGVVIGEAGITSISKRAPGQVMVESHAWSRNVEVAIEGTGTLRIGEVRLDVVTKAGGRPGTATVEENRVIEGVELRDAQGKLLFACGADCDVNVVAANVNEMIGGDMRMTVPKAEIVETPKGAFAGFHKPYDKYVNDLVMNNDSLQALPAIQLEVYSDFSDKSRTYVQLAAIDSSSLYGITGAVGEVSAPGGLLDPVTPGPLPDPAIPGIDPSSFVPSIPAAAPGANAGPGFFQGLPARVVRQALFLARSPGEAASMVLVVSLVLGFAGLSIRRRALGGVL